MAGKISDGDRITGIGEAFSDSCYSSSGRLGNLALSDVWSTLSAAASLERTGFLHRRSSSYCVGLPQRCAPGGSGPPRALRPAAAPGVFTSRYFFFCPLGARDL